MYFTVNELKKWLPALANRPLSMDSIHIEYSNNPTGTELKWITAKTFYNAVGFTQVTSMDIPGCEIQPDLTHDMNIPFTPDLYNRYNLILDPGTTEHVFDVKTCLSNIVRALKIGGTVIHQVPVYAFNGGYYSINPNLFNDFYQKNGFGLATSYLILWDRYRPYTGQYRCYEYTQDLTPRHALADYDQCRFSPLLLFFAQKQTDVDKIQNPIQYEGEYVSNTVKSPVSHSATHIKRLVMKIINTLPFELSYYVKAFGAREKQLYKTRKHSFMF